MRLDKTIPKSQQLSLFMQHVQIKLYDDNYYNDVSLSGKRFPT